MYAGARHGFIAGLLELIGIVVSVAIPFLLYIPAGHVLAQMGVSQVYAGAVAFLIIWFITLILYFWGVRRLYRRVPREVRISRTNAIFGILPGFVRGLIFLTVLLAVFTALPTSLIKPQTIDSSLFAPPLLDVVTAVTTSAADVFGEAAQSALGFLTVKPDEKQIIRLKFQVAHPAVDENLENQMLVLVNQERVSRGLQPLRMDDSIRQVAREHSIDMFKRGYFAHMTPEGVSPFARIERGGVRFITAGENLALAPTLRMAHTGLMNSPGHRANILSPAFHRIGIGAARGGRYGIMFTQNFAN